MSRKKPHAEEHENLERWLVSYADFITLLFATFVVLYALSQSDAAAYTKLQDSIQQAFSAGVMQGSMGVMNNSGESILANTPSPTSTSVPPILEHIGTKYEEESFKQIQEAINALKAQGQLKGVEVKIDDRGLIIKLKDLSLFFDSGSATLKPDAIKTINSIGELLKGKFNSHIVKVEGHTDSEPIQSGLYPSNWELSSARSCAVIRHFIIVNKFDRNKLAAIGYADSKPAAENKTEKGKKRNRRVEIVVLRNKHTSAEPIKKSDLYKTHEQIQDELNEKVKNVPHPTVVKDNPKEKEKEKPTVVKLSGDYEQKRDRLKKELMKDESARREKLYKKKAEELNSDMIYRQTLNKEYQEGNISNAAIKLLNEYSDRKQQVVIPNKH